METGDIRGAVTDFSAAIQQRSSFAAAYDGRGNARRRLGDIEGALADYNYAIEQDARNPSFLYDRGCTHYDQHAWDRALVDFRTATELDPTGQDYARIRTWLVLMRLGHAQDAETVLAGIVRRPKSQRSDGWVERIASFLAGHIPEREFLDSVHTAYSKTVHGRECQAYFYVGSLRLLKHDLRGARAEFEKRSLPDRRRSLSTSALKLRCVGSGRAIEQPRAHRGELMALSASQHGDARSCMD